MKVVIGGKRVTLRDRDVLGTGGEATVIKWDNRAVKLYHQPDLFHEAKLNGLLALAPRLPAQVIAPEEPVWNEQGNQLIGFTMRALPSGYEPVAALTRRGYRDVASFDTNRTLAILLDMQKTLHTIHDAGLVVGDFNDANELFNPAGTSPLAAFIDVDSYQFGDFPCRVATQDYLDPQLYSMDLQANPVFTPANDWYSFAVLAFRSLLLVHPYGGTHPRVKDLSGRAQARLTVFDSTVTYPRVGMNPQLLTDELAHTFWQIFSEGWRGIFPPNALVVYRDSLVECSGCHQWYPIRRSHCPVCSATAAFVMPAMVDGGGLRSEEFIATRGKIVFWQMLGDTFYSVAHEDGNAVLYSRSLGGAQRRQVLFPQVPGARYSLTANFLMVSPGNGSDKLQVVDLGSTSPNIIAQTTTDLFGGQQPAFGCSDRYFYRVAGGMLMRGEIKWWQFLERPVTGVLENQTWFEVSPNSTPGNETLLGFSRVFQDYEFFLLNRDGRQHVNAGKLLPDESLEETRAIFAGETVLLARRTRQNGREWLRLEIIDQTGKVLHSRRGRLDEFARLQSLNALAFAGTVVLFPTEEGVLRVDLATGEHKLLSATRTCVGEADGLVPFGRGLLVVSENRVTNLILTGKA